MQPKEAAEAAGVSVATFRRWRARGRVEPGTVFARLCERLVEAEARFEQTHLERIVAAGTVPAVTTIVTEKVDREGNPVKETRTTTAPSVWQASAWLLERTRPDRYALIKRVETGPPGSFDHLDDKELNAAILRLVEGGGKKRRSGGSSGGDGEAA